MFHSTNPKEDFRPYLLRAWHEWSSDLGYTPHITVQVNRGNCKVPQAFVRDGSITFNISYQATNQLRIDNEWIGFQGRFGGQVHVISVPVHAVVACFVREKEEVMPLYFDDSEFDEINDLNDISNVNNANNVEKQKEKEHQKDQQNEKNAQDVENDKINAQKLAKFRIIK